jgi:hypothetical protein
MLISRRKAGRSREEKSDTIKASNGTTLNKKQQRQEAAERRKSLSDRKKLLNQAEKKIHQLENLKEDLQRELSDPNLYREVGESTALQKRLGQVEKDLKYAEDEWSTAQEKFDEFSKKAQLI